MGTPVINNFVPKFWIEQVHFVPTHFFVSLACEIGTMATFTYIYTHST
jgi:hypothetical protein